MRLKLLLAAVAPMLLLAPSPAAAEAETTTAPVVSTPGAGTISASDRILGAPDAPVIVAEYGDLRCPDSARAATEYLPQIQRDFLSGPDIRYEFRDFPLDVHPQAVDAAAAARCAGSQDKYLDFRTRLLSDLTPLTPERMERLATESGLDPGFLKSCIERGEHADDVRREKAAGERLGVHATPTYVIFTRKPGREARVHTIVKNPRSYDELRSAIEKARKAE